MRALITFILSAIAICLVGGFIAGDFNVMEWHPIVRFWIVIVAIVITIFAGRDDIQ